MNICSFASVKKLILIFGCFFLFKSILPVLDYFIRYDIYANELCENKEDTVLACNGKCQLAKELAKASEEKNPFSNDKKNKTFEFEILFLEKIETFSFKFSQDLLLKANFHYSNLYQYQSFGTAFHPPSFLL